MLAPTPLPVRLGIWAWLLAALAVGHFQLLRAIIGPAIPAMVFTLAGLVSAARLVLSAPQEMQAFTRLPLALLPTFLVPLIIATHIIIYLRLRRALAATTHAP